MVYCNTIDTSDNFLDNEEPFTCYYFILVRYSILLNGILYRLRTTL